MDAKRRRVLIKGRRAVVRKLRQAGFIISPKSELAPSKRLVFVGKFLDSVRKSMQNQPAVLAAAFRMWLRGVGTGLMCAADLLRFLGRVQWLSKPASLSYFLAGAYQAAYKGSSRFTRGLICSTATALLFCTAPQSYAYRAPRSAPTFFADAVPPRQGTCRFTVGIVGPKGCYRARRCPAWIQTLPQAELYGLYTAAKIAAYEGMSDVTIGVNSDTARMQALSERAATACPVQNKLLRRLFWPRVWSAQRLVLFRVPLTLNPADPMSRANGFPSFPQAMREADLRRLRWENSDQPYQALTHIDPPPWSLRACT